MLKKHPILKWILIVLSSILILIISFGFWFMSLIPSDDNKKEISKTLAEDLPYLSENSNDFKGKILAVVTSTNRMGSSNKKTGYELTELARAYYVFKANGFDVDIASPKGGTPPAIIDWDDMGAFDYAFLNDTIAQLKVKHTIPLSEITNEDYEAVFFAGGKGAMFDFPENKKIQSIVKEYYQSKKVVGAVCHGPSALINVTLDDGSSLLHQKTISSFTNQEELLLIPDAKEIFPFLLEDVLVAKGARFNTGYLYLKNISVDKNLVTGQNPWSTWALAEAMIQQLGYKPKKRVITAEENTINILDAYESLGYDKAKTALTKMYKSTQQPIDRNLLAMHSIVKVMQWKISESIDLIRLLKHAEKLANNPD